MSTTQPTYFRIQILNPPLDSYETTYLTNDYASAVSSLAIMAKEGFYKADHGNDTYFYILISEYGREKAELVRVTADDTANGTLATGSTKYSHSASDPVTYIPYNQVKIYGRTSSGGTNVLLATIGLNPTQQYTTYVYEGSDYSYFVTAYYNSDNDEISAYSDEIQNSSFGFRTVKRVLDSAARKALTSFDENPDSVLSYDIGIEILQDGFDEILARKRKWPFLHTIDTSISTVSNTAYINKPTDCLMPDFVTVDGRKCAWMTQRQFQEYTHTGSTAPTGQPTHYTIRNNKIYFYPTPSAVYTTEIDYYKYVATVTSLDTTVDLAFVPILVYYCASQFAYIRANDKRGDKLYAMYSKLLEQQVEEYSGPTQSGEAEGIEQTNAYSYQNELNELE